MRHSRIDTIQNWVYVMKHVIYILYLFEVNLQPYILSFWKEFYILVYVTEHRIPNSLFVPDLICLRFLSIPLVLDLDFRDKYPILESNQCLLPCCYLYSLCLGVWHLAKILIFIMWWFLSVFKSHSHLL